MEQECWAENSSISVIKYHFVWIVRRKRKVLVGAIDKRLKELINQAVAELNCRVIAVETCLDYVHLFLQSNTQVAPYQIMYKIKRVTAFALRKEFPQLMKLPSMWTRGYFCGTSGGVSPDTIKQYVENQKTT